MKKAYVLDDSDIERLMGYLDMTYHKTNINFKDLSTCSCGNYGCSVVDYCSKCNLHFDNDEEMMMVYRKIVDKEKWYEFWEYCKVDCAWCVDDVHIVLTPHLYVAWILEDPIRFCKMASRFIKEESKK